MKKVLILGAAGFLGSALEHRLKEEGCHVVSVARKRPLYRESVANEFSILDLTNAAEFHTHFFRHHFDEVYQMASDVGGVGYIADKAHDAAILTNSLKINLHTLEAIKIYGNCDRIFLASSQCVYPESAIEVDPFANERLVSELDLLPRAFREQDARFEPNFAFSKEKLYSEALYQAYALNHGIEVRIGRLGNTFGPYCEWREPRAKSVAAICRKVAEADYAGSIRLWGDGTQTRSFTYVDDTVTGIIRLMRSDYAKPLNLASSEVVSIQQLFEIICRKAGKILAWEREPGPVGVSSRGSDNTLCRQVLDWEPPHRLAEGIQQTYAWIAKQVLTKQPV